jgi:uncharacterized protein with HEPN domain
MSRGDPLRVGDCYFKIDQGIVWRTIEIDMPALSRALQAALSARRPA